jgi:hypothetical protein
VTKILGPPASGPSFFAACFSLRHYPLGKPPLARRGLVASHQFREGHLLSILAMIRSAIEMASAMADSSAGEGLPSQFTSLRAARILAAISKTRFRPSSIGGHQTVMRVEPHAKLREVTNMNLAYSPFIRYSGMETVVSA